MGSELALRCDLEGPVRSALRTVMIGIDPGILERGRLGQ